MKALLLFFTIVFAVNIVKAEVVTIQLPHYSDILGNPGDTVNFNGALVLDRTNSSLEVVTHSPALSFYSPPQTLVVARIGLQSVSGSGTQFKIVAIDRLSENMASTFIFKPGGVFDFSAVFRPATPLAAGMPTPQYVIYQDDTIKRFVRFNTQPSTCPQVLRPGYGGAQ